MGNKKSTASDSSKGALARQRINVRMVQNVLLIWLNNNTDENNTDYCNTITQLRRVVNNINTFTDGDQCVEFLNTVTNNKACMIISGSLGQHIVPRVHDMSQVDSIFIFCDNKKWHEQWVKQWPKIKGVFTEITSICEALKQVAQQCEQNAIPISFVDTSGDVSKKNLDQLELSFMYTQILKEILLTIQFQEKHVQEFFDHCRDAFAGNQDELKNVDQLQKQYHDKTPIWWSTCESFLYPMLNGALRLMDVDTIIKIGFFIGDLHRHIEQLHSEQSNNHQFDTIFTVYRGQGMSKIDFDRMTTTKGGLISFNNFLSTSKDRNVSLNFARDAISNPDLVGIFFVMTVDPSISSNPFASIADVDYCGGAEAKILFSMHTVFRIRDIKPMDESPHRLFQVDLTLTNDNDQDLRVLTDRIREQSFPNAEGWERLGSVLLKMGQSEKAQQVYEIILEQTTDESEKAHIYHQIGWAKDDQGEYQEAITFYKKALEIKQKTLPSNHPDLAMSYNNIGNVYIEMGEYSKGLSSHEKAIEIRQKSLPPNHPDLAMSYNNIGNVYDKMGKYSKALSYYEKALEIAQKSLPPNHPDLGGHYNNIGNVYVEMGQYPKALSSQEKALEIRQKTLPPNHPDLGSEYNNMGVVYENMGNYSKACSFYERALDIGEHSLPPNHPDLKDYRKNLERVKKKL